MLVSQQSELLGVMGERVEIFLLLLATEAGLLNYWSSGGVLRSRPVYELLQIPATQVLLGAVFLFPNALPDVETKPGANRGKQGQTARWIREIQLDG